MPKPKRQTATDEWKLGEEYSNGMDEIINKEGRCIAIVWTRRGPNGNQGPRPCYRDCPEGQAVARLIIAAPALLEACSNALGASWQEDGNETEEDYLRKVHRMKSQLAEAIKKATGTEPEF